MEYEPLPVAIDPLRSAKGNDSLTPILYESLGTNVAFSWTIHNGDSARAFQEADGTMAEVFKVQRIAGVAMEPRGVLSTYDDATGFLTVWTASHRPHALKTSLARVLDYPENKIRVIIPAVGGSFGSKTNTTAEEVLLAAISLKLKRPVKWIATRSEDLLSCTHARDALADVEVAYKNDGSITAIRGKVVGDMGAYWHRLAHAPTMNFGRFLTGCYKIQNIDVEVLGVYTNKMATHVLRGTGRPEGAYVAEKIADRVALKLGLDPIEVRLKNFIPPTAFPYHTASGLVYDSGDYVAALKKALSIANYSSLSEEQKKLRAQGRLIGIGISSYVEVSSMAGGWEYVEVRTEPTGKFTILSGISSHGQSTDSTLREVFAKQMGVDVRDVEIITGDTAIVPYGWGSIAARSLQTAGAGVVMAARELKEKFIEAASSLLEISPHDLTYESGRVIAKGATGISLSIKEIARSVFAHHGITDRARAITHPLSVAELPQVDPSYPYGAHICMVEIDKETGRISILKYVAVDDCGNIISERLVNDQVIGGIVFGLSEAMLEEVVYDDNGNLLTSTLMDYTVATSSESPSKIDCDYTQVPALNPLGVKGSSEGGTVGSISVIGNAVEDALAPLGARVSSLPVSQESIWRKLHTHQKE